MLEGTDLIVWGVTASLLAGLCTGIGALGIFLIRRLTDFIQSMLLSAAAGIMLAAAFFSLLLPGIEFAETQLHSKALAVLVVTGGLFLGAFVLYLIHQHAPHEHFSAGHEGPDSTLVSRIWLFVIAITLHNFPEGMAVGVGFAGADMDNGIALATGIGLQNIPEGLAVAASLAAIDYSRTKAFALAFLTGLVEPVGGLIGSLAINIAKPLLPWVLGFAAGAMLFVISNEIIPETHGKKHKNLATFSLLGGFAVMMFLDAALI